MQNTNEHAIYYDNVTAVTLSEQFREVPRTLYITLLRNVSRMVLKRFLAFPKNKSVNS